MTNATTTEFPIVGFALVTADEAVEFATEDEANEYCELFGGWVAPVVDVRS
jgi:hypothetical protein